jgi:hypothetical protein
VYSNTSETGLRMTMSALALAIAVPSFVAGQLRPRE